MRARFVPLLVAAISLAALGAACSSSTAPPFLGDEGNVHPPPATAIGGDDGDTSTDGAVCAVLDNEGAIITVENVGESLPAAIGGTIAEATYLLTAENYYTGVGGTAGPTGATVQQTLSLTDTTLVFSLATGNLEAGTLGDSSTTSGSYMASGMTLAFEEDCPLAMTTTLGYSVDGNTLHIFSGQIESIYTAQ
jgi:hypothetical protein